MNGWWYRDVENHKEVRSVKTRRDIRITSIGRGGTGHTLIGTFPGYDEFAGSRKPGSTTFLEAWFGRSTRGRMLGRRFYLGINDSYEVRVFDGVSLERILRLERDPVHVTEDDLRILRTRFEELQDETFRKDYLALLADMDVPATMPAFGVGAWRPRLSSHPLVVDRLGHLWVREYNRPGDQSSRWSVFSSDGSLLGGFELPDGLLPFEIGESYVLGKWTDSLDVEDVRLYTLER